MQKGFDVFRPAYTAIQILGLTTPHCHKDHAADRRQHFSPIGGVQHPPSPALF